MLSCEPATAVKFGNYKHTTFCISLFSELIKCQKMVVFDKFKGIVIYTVVLINICCIIEENLKLGDNK